jgi:hypothetical protein
MRNKKYRLILILISAIIFLSVIIAVINNEFYSGIKQPVPFNHKVHVTENNVSCTTCHEGIFNSEKTGIPPLKTCISCHERINKTNPSIQFVHEKYIAGKPVEWKKVTSFDEFVNFDHSVHARKGIDCSKCHGKIAGMDRVKEEIFMDMKFCMKCHAQENVKAGCNSCHE